MYVPQLILDKPISAGFAILELSKLRMYDLYYNYFKINYKEDSEYYIDTDSLCINIKTMDQHRNLRKANFKNILDTNNFLSDHILYDDVNKNKLGVLKFECTDPVFEFVGLKAKQCALSFGGNRTKKAAKGIKKSVVQTYNFETYKSTLFNNARFKNKQCFIRVKQHEIYTFMHNKSALCSYYHKKSLGDDCIFSVCYGHFSICK